MATKDSEIWKDATAKVLQRCSTFAMLSSREIYHGYRLDGTVGPAIRKILVDPITAELQRLEGEESKFPDGPSAASSYLHMAVMKGAAVMNELKEMYGIPETRTQYLDTIARDSKKRLRDYETEYLKAQSDAYKELLTIYGTIVALSRVSPHQVEKPAIDGFSPESALKLIQSYSTFLGQWQEMDVPANEFTPALSAMNAMNSMRLSHSFMRMSVKTLDTYIQRDQKATQDVADMTDIALEVNEMLRLLTLEMRFIGMGIKTTPA